MQCIFDVWKKAEFRLAVAKLEWNGFVVLILGGNTFGYLYFQENFPFCKIFHFLFQRKMEVTAGLGEQVKPDTTLTF